jgi:hypothetical protein
MLKSEAEQISREPADNEPASADPDNGNWSLDYALDR